MTQRLYFTALLCLATTLACQSTCVRAQNIGFAKQVLVNHETTLTWPLPENWRERPIRFEVKAGERVLGKGLAKITTVDDTDSISINILIESVNLTAITECQVTLNCAEHWFPTPVILFPEHPFENHRKTIEKLGIQLFDTTDSNTKSVFDEHQIPYTALKSMEDLEPNAGSLLIIGEGLEYDEDLSKLLSNASEQGVNILCLSPSGTELSFTLGDQLVLLRQSPSQNSFGVNWQTSLAATKFWQPCHDEGKFTFTTGEEHSGWPWIELQSAKPKSTDQTGKVTNSPGSLIVCGFPIIEKHDETPAARHFLAKLLIEQTKSGAIQDR